MTVIDWAVVVAGLGAIAWVNWYFLVPPRAGAALDRLQAPDSRLRHDQEGR